MAKKYIDTDGLKEFYEPYSNRGLKIPVDVILANIDDMPAADVVEVLTENDVLRWCKPRNYALVAKEDFPRLEVRHGRWIIENKYTDYRTERCSACGFAANRAYIQDIWRYCPNCGASMNGE